MKKAGCSTVCLGIESGSDRILSILNKGTSVKKIQKIVKLINEIGIWVVGFFILGNPSETKKEMEQSLRFAEQLLPDMIQLHFFSSYPGSLAFKLYGGMNGFSKFKPLNSYSRISVNKLEKFQKYFYKRYYFNPRFIKKYIYRQGLFFIRNFWEEKNLIKKTLSFLL
jgi:radical SAM superfamily enzyme YgiQ (UPF0313 family)